MDKKKIKLGRIYKKRITVDSVVNFIPEYILIRHIQLPDNIIAYTRYYYYDIGRGHDCLTYFTYGDLNRLYELVER